MLEVSYRAGLVIDLSWNLFGFALFLKKSPFKFL